MSAQDCGVSLDNITLKLGQQDFALNCMFEPGKVTAVVGPSGSGKSTLLNLVAGFETPDAGRVLIDGRDVNGLDPSERPASLIFQDNNLFSHLDIFTNVGLGVSPSLKLTADDKTAISHALSRVGLGGFEKRLPSTLSGGERQRAALARALVRQRAVMLLDEPFAALDPGLRSGMSALLKELHDDLKNTVLLVTHHPDDIRRLAHDVIFLSNGHVVYKGKVEDFFSATHVEEIRTFLAL
ncbi:ATP-binding cassette domain-containing protein [Agrobacterium rosae]|uniref:ATP-binding cassette domain-containing protein n=1 Tax=Agrobacterium rosae TaxID=1972867 RepID=A0AAE5VMX8_9HYPH|nr:ATP-binding cassette domain-containing protein [Agrobacterium rosae]KAA3510464.1 ATP-binding cassette domain-containing protein [Agrobacterium rosae]KAA3517185.1 ATP-binding cassette domain-containing protein [Agrobacterium rosae]MCM2434627.1 ATP-binding cassette domain-containing protein [Agrobacterium rosae]MDX8330167.1 ATP-binding cassette domain-containing protein [Agrobacterium rosae]MQB49908.1 ATP-binding cassette domain-containing protein [Agrobacterium rosae]